MLKSRMILKILLGLFLAFGLIFSPLQNPTVVFSSQSMDDIAPSQEVAPEADRPVDVPVDNQQPPVDQPEPGADGSAIDPIHSEVAPETDTGPAEQVSTNEPDAPAATEAVGEDNVPVETALLAESNSEPTVEETQANVATQLPDETLSEVEPTVQEPPAAAGEEPSSPDEEQRTANSEWTSGQVVLRFNPVIPMEEQIARLTALGLEITASEPILGVLVVKVPTGLEEETVNTLSTLEGIQYVELDYTGSALDVTPNDPFFSNQGDMLAINAPGGWEYYTGSSGVIIAIIDSGVDLYHPDLAGKIIQGWDFVNNDDSAQDDFGHGTHVAGIAAAVGNNSTGIAGLDWSAKILPIKVLNSSGFGSALNISQGIIYAVDHGAKIINLSLGFTSNSALVADAVNYAYQHGVTIIASTGNSNGAVTYPAALPQVIAVGAVDNNGTRWASSNFGPEVDLVAPGVNIYSTNPSGYGTRTGTSMAAAHVSGLAALLEGMSSLTPDQVKTAMTSTSRDLGTAGWDALFGNGLIQVRDAILQLFNALFPVHREREESKEEMPTLQFLPTFTPTLTPTLTPTPSPTPIM
jgi:subtilisin family serine protease